MDAATPSPPGPLALDRFLPYRLSVVSNAVSEAIAEVYRRPHGLGITEWRLLAVLAERPGLTSVQLHARTRIDKVSISRALKQLETRGWVQREPVADDRRRWRLQPTAAGMRLHAEVAPAVQRRELELLGALDSGERAALAALLDRLEQRLAAALGGYQPD